MIFTGDIYRLYFQVIFTGDIQRLKELIFVPVFRLEFLYLQTDEQVVSNMRVEIMESNNAKFANLFPRKEIGKSFC